jgi:DNA-binding transcriptional LysR family regulator
VVKHRGITAASRKMSYGIQQPAISGQLSRLEKNLGARLFHRRPFGLTPAGAKLFTKIESFFGGLTELPDQIRGDVAQHLRLAAPAIILRDYLPKMIVDHKRLFRDLRLTLYDANQAAAEELLRKREIDLAITELEGKPASFVRSSILMQLPLVLIIPKSAKFRNAEEFFRAPKPSQNLISLRTDEVISKIFQAGLSKLRVSWTPAIEVSSLELIQLYASLGFGVGLSVMVPGKKRRKDLRVVPLRKFPALTIAALWSGQLSESAATFLKSVQNLAAQLTRG